MEKGFRGKAINDEWMEMDGHPPTKRSYLFVVFLGIQKVPT